jgi:MFS family permease
MRVLFGLGYGAYTSVGWALSIDVFPSLKDAAQDLGLRNASGILPDVFAPLIGSFIIYIAASYGQTALGYRLVFTVAMLILVVASLSILFVREISTSSYQYLLHTDIKIGLIAKGNAIQW